jgi:hypothetical protein
MGPRVLINGIWYVFKVFFIDEYRPDNIPLTSEGRLAFIDTEHSRRRRVTRSQALTMEPHFCHILLRNWIYAA